MLMHIGHEEAVDFLAVVSCCPLVQTKMILILPLLTVCVYVYVYVLRTRMRVGYSDNRSCLKCTCHLT